MPIYEYEILSKDGTPKGIFETTQKMSEPALKRHPVTGEPVRRILSATFIGSRGSSSGADYASAACSTGSCGVPAPGGCASGSFGWD